MTTEKLKQANKLLAEIQEMERTIKNAKNQPCEFIYFSFGNGSNREVVCGDSKIIEKVRNLVILENELKLDSLKNEFNTL
jgi:hypothetical protein